MDVHLLNNHGLEVITGLIGHIAHKCLSMFDVLKPGESSEIESEEEEDESSTSQDDKDDSGKTAKSDSKASKDNKAKPRDDLAMYKKFFPELFEFQVGLTEF